MRSRSLFIVACACLTGAVGCIGETELEGKACPCLDTHVCDAVLKVCVKPGSSGAGQVGAAVKPSQLRAEWTTSNSIRWLWTRDSQDDPNQLAGYRLAVAATEAEVLSETGAETWSGSLDLASSDRHINPELARYALPRTNDSEPLEATLTDLHQADSVVFARLIATDTAGRQWATNIAQARTTIAPFPSDEVILFSESEVPGISIPTTFERTAGAAHEGSFHYEWTNDTGIPFEQLRIQPNPTIPVDAVSEGDFETTAVFEVAVRVQSDAPSFWSEMWLRFGKDFYARFKPLTYRNDDAYRVIQVPLRVLSDNSGELLKHSQLTSGVEEINVGGFFSDGAVVRVDEARIRW